MVERNLAKVEVAGSSPVIRSKQKTEGRTMFFLFSFLERDIDTLKKFKQRIKRDRNEKI